MVLARAASRLARPAIFRAVPRRAFTASIARRDDSGKYDYIKPQIPAGKQTGRNMDKELQDIESKEDLQPEGANPGTVPSDLEQATGLERLEILGKMQGIDVFDMRPLPSDRLGTVDDPIVVQAHGKEQYLGCTGSPSGSHTVRWITVSRFRPLGRCTECGSCYFMEFIGRDDDGHGHDHGHGHDEHQPEWHGDGEWWEPHTFADWIKPEYYYR